MLLVIYQPPFLQDISRLRIISALRASHGNTLWTWWLGLFIFVYWLV
jgi:hypothetical protein